jgi:hypothetical protein
MNRNKVTLAVFAWIAGAGSLYALLAMLTQAMLGGTSEKAVWWDRVYAWWVDFLAAGLLLMLAIYLWRRARRPNHAKNTRTSRAKWRVVAFPAGHLLLTGSFYCADFAWYLREYGARGPESSSIYFPVAALLLFGAVVAFWYAHKLKFSNGDGGVSPYNQRGI